MQNWMLESGRITPRAYSGLRTRAYWDQTQRGCSVMLFGVNGNKERLILTHTAPLTLGARAIVVCNCANCVRSDPVLGRQSTTMAAAEGSA